MGLAGKLIQLREEHSDDLPFLVGLRNDLETQGWSQTLPPDYTLNMYRKKYDEREFSFQRNEGRFIIELKETDEAVGSCVYLGLQPRWEATVGMIVAKSHWGTGVAFDAQEVILKFLFEELGLRVVRLWTQSGNERALGLPQKSGFQISLRMHEAIFKGGKRYDTINMDLLREEYYALHPELEDNLPSLNE